MCQPVTVPLRALLGRERRAGADTVEDRAGPVSDTTIERARGVSVERAAGRVGRRGGDVRQLERLAVIERGVAAAMVHRDGMLSGDAIEIADVERALVFELGVVEEVSLDPVARRSRARLRPELVDDARDGDELHLERIPDEHFVEERRTARVVVAV